MNRQLVLPGLEATTWELLDRPDDGPPPSPSLARDIPPGPARLLRRLVRDGLDPDALPAAATLVLGLDRDTLQGNHHNQEDNQGDR